MLQLLWMKAYLQMFEKIHDHSTCTPVVRTLSGNNRPRTSIYKTDLGRTWRRVFHHACLPLVDQMIQFVEHVFFRLPDVGWKKSFWPAAIWFGTNLRPRMPVTNEAVGWDSRTKKCNPGVDYYWVRIYIQTISVHPNIFQMGWFNMVQPPTRWQFNTRCFCPLTTIFVDLCLVIPIYNHGFS